MIPVTCLDTGEQLCFDASTPLEAMQKLLDFLNLSHNDPDAKIHKTETNLHLYTIHKGKTYAAMT